MFFFDDSTFDHVVELLSQYLGLTDSSAIPDKDTVGIFEFIFTRIPDIALELWKQVDLGKALVSFLPVLIYVAYNEINVEKLLKEVSKSEKSSEVFSQPDLEAKVPLNDESCNKKKAPNVIVKINARKNSKTGMEKQVLSSTLKLNDKCESCQSIKSELDLKQTVILSPETETGNFDDQLNASSKRSKSKIIQANDPHLEMKLAQAVGSIVVSRNNNALTLKNVRSSKRIKTALASSRLKLNASMNSERRRESAVATTVVTSLFSTNKKGGKKEKDGPHRAIDNLISSWNRIKTELRERRKDQRRRQLDQINGENVNSQSEMVDLKGRKSKLEVDKERKIIKEEGYKRTASSQPNELMNRELEETQVPEVQLNNQCTRPTRTSGNDGPSPEVSSSEVSSSEVSSSGGSSPAGPSPESSSPEDPSPDSPPPPRPQRAERDNLDVIPPRYSPSENHAIKYGVFSGSERSPLNRRRASTTPIIFCGATGPTVQNQERPRRFAAKNLKRNKITVAIKSIAQPVFRGKAMGEGSLETGMVSKLVENKGDDNFDEIKNHQTRLMTELNNFTHLPGNFVRVTRKKLGKIQPLNKLDPGDGSENKISDSSKRPEQNCIETESAQPRQLERSANKSSPANPSPRKNSTDSVKYNKATRLRARYIKSQISNNQSNGARRKISSLPSTPRRKRAKAEETFQYQSISCPPTPGK